MIKPKMTRAERLLATQREYEKWSENVEFVTETGASDEDEAALLDTLLEKGLIEGGSEADNTKN
jgi:hypothetical protein